MPRRNLCWLLGIAGVSMLCWAIAQGGAAPPRGPLQFIKGLPGYQEDYEGLNLLIDVLQHVEQSYVHELSGKDRRKFIEESITGGLQSLDQHSSFLSQRDYEQFQRQSTGVFGGVGIQIVVSRDTKKLTVVSPIVGTPAYKAGVKPGDEIEKINGEPTQGMQTQDAVDKIQGPPGSQVTLTIRHRGSEKPVDIKLTRSRIEVESILGDLRDADKHWDFIVDKPNRIAYVRLAQFGHKTAAELQAVLEKLQEQKVRGLVLDLRNNPGGLLGAAVEISDLFLTQGRIVGIQGRGRPGEGFDAKEPETLLTPPANYPMAVLVNEASASASEIVAAALQDHKRAIVIGERSFGKGSVQNLIPMESGKSALKLTTAKYMRPSGKNIHRFPESKDEDDWGVRPDVEVKLTLAETLDYLRGRQQRDVVRDEQTSADNAEKLLALVSPVWSGIPVGQPWKSVAAAVQSAGTYHSLPKDPDGNPTDLISKPFVDKVLDKALEHVRKQLKS